MLGNIIKVLGYDGTVAVKLVKAFAENVPVMESVFIETEGRPVPFFISESDYSGGDILRLRFDGYESDIKIRGFAGCKVYLVNVPDIIPDDPDGPEITGYTALLKNGENLGIISDVIKNPAQWLIRIMSAGNKEILVPFHEDFIIKSDNIKRIIIFDLPEGLTEVN